MQIVNFPSLVHLPCNRGDWEENVDQCVKACSETFSRIAFVLDANAVNRIA
jgi:hypothetical protein